MADPFVSDPKDVELEESISRSVRGMGSHMHVSVRGGHVTVSGTADDYETKREILSAVRSVPGVHEVTNNIRVARTAD
jgi:osmotically-inducible protein OsmY